MNTPGQRVHWKGLPCWASHTVISIKASPAKSWLDPPNRIQILCQNPVHRTRKVKRIPTTEPTWGFRKAGIRSPTSSALATLMNRRTSCMTVSAMTVRNTAPDVEEPGHAAREDGPGPLGQHRLVAGEAPKGRGREDQGQDAEDRFREHGAARHGERVRLLLQLARGARGGHQA